MSTKVSAAVAAVVLIATLAAGARWSLDQPLPTMADEAHYLKFLCHDRDRWAHGGVRAVAEGIVYDDRTRPPAYRLGVAPWVALAGRRGTDLADLRLASIGWLVATAAVMVATVRRLTGSVAAGLIAAAGGCLATKVLLSTVHFGTEYAIYFGTALTGYGLVRDWDVRRPKLCRCWPLAAGIAISALSKASFAPLTVLPVAMVLALWWAGRVRGPGPAYLVTAVAAAAVVAGPWWAFNGGRAIAFARLSVDFQRRSFGPRGVASSLAYLASVVRYEIGLPVSLLIAVPLVAFAVRRRRAERSPLGWAVAVLAVPALVMIGYQMLSANQDGRLVSHAFLPLAVAATVAAAALRWRWAPPLAAACLAVQAAMLAGPTGAVDAVAARVPLLAVSHRPVLRHWPTCDWSPVRAACLARGLTGTPRVAMLGDSFTFNSDQLEIPWAQHGGAARVSQMWRWDLGAYSPAAIAAEVARADVVLTAPALVGDATEHEERDNAHNADLAAQLTADPAFGPPTRLVVGQDDPVAVDVFFRRRATTRAVP